MGKRELKLVDPRQPSDAKLRRMGEIVRERMRLEAEAREAELSQDLRAAQDREAGLSSLVDSLGHSSITLGPLDWSTDAARALLADEAASLERLDSMLADVRGRSSCIRALIAEQEGLRSQLCEVRQVAAA